MWTPIAGKPGQQRCTLHATEFPIGRVCPDPGCVVHGAAGTREPSEAEQTQSKAKAIGLPTLLDYEKRFVGAADYWNRRTLKLHHMADQMFSVRGGRNAGRRRKATPDGEKTELVYREPRIDPAHLERLAQQSAETARKNLREAADLCTLRTEAADTEHLEGVVAGAEKVEAN